MDMKVTYPPRLKNGQKTPDLELPTLQGGAWKLSDQSPENFTLLWVIRGYHCTFCQAELEVLSARLDDIAALGCSLFVTSMDDKERADKTLAEWVIGDVPMGYGLSEEDARAWGLYISSRVKDKEPDVFAEPGLYLVAADGTLYSQFQSTAPWLRLDIDILLRGIKIALERGTPPRGILT